MDSQSQQARAGAKPRQVREFRRDAQRGDTPAYLQDRNEAIVATLYDIGLRVGELVALDTEFLHIEEGGRTCLSRQTHRKIPRPSARRTTPRVLRVAVERVLYGVSCLAITTAGDRRRTPASRLSVPEFWRVVGYNELLPGGEKLYITHSVVTYRNH
jgi:integrase